MGAYQQLGKLRVMLAWVFDPNFMYPSVPREMYRMMTRDIAKYRTQENCWGCFIWFLRGRTWW